MRMASQASGGSGEQLISCRLNMRAVHPSAYYSGLDDISLIISQVSHTIYCVFVQQ
jgi:hypothetical protein